MDDQDVILDIQWLEKLFGQVPKRYPRIFLFLFLGSEAISMQKVQEAFIGAKCLTHQYIVCPKLRDINDQRFRRFIPLQLPPIFQPTLMYWIRNRGRDFLELLLLLLPLFSLFCVFFQLWYASFIGTTIIDTEPPPHAF